MTPENLSPFNRRAHTYSAYAVVLVVVIFLALAGCYGSHQLKADALVAVAGHVKHGDPAQLRLTAEGNPWGEGILVVSQAASNPGDVYAWLFWSARGTFPAQRDLLYALDAQTAKLTPGVPLLIEASDDVQRRSGFEAVPITRVRQVILNSIRQNVPLGSLRGAAATR